MARTQLELAVIEMENDNAVIGGPNKVANPSFQGSTNFWTVASATQQPVITSSGIQLVGSGQFYQNLNTTDVANGTSYMARIYVNTVSGTWKMLGATVASGDKASGAYSVSLATGWNSVRFDAGATHRINLTSADEASTDTLICSPVEIREQIDLTITGQIRNLDVEFSGGTIDGTLIVASDVTCQADLLVNSDILVSGGANIGILSVVGSANVGSDVAFLADLNVTSILTVGNDLIVNSDAVVSGTLSAASIVTSGTALFGKAVTISGAVSLNTTTDGGNAPLYFKVSGVTSWTDYLDKDTKVLTRHAGNNSYQLNIGNAYNGTEFRFVTASGNFYAASNITASGNLIAASIVTSGKATIGASINANGATIASGFTFTASNFVCASLPEASGDAQTNGFFRDGAGTGPLYIKG